ncbi:Fc.00g000620.m01.CDS01 [Cosmosporella sp. VM-42]
MASSLTGKINSPRVVNSSTSRCVEVISPVRKSVNLRGSRRCSTLKTLSKDVASDAPAAPLSGLPTPVLLRSLLVNTISSKPYLLTPALALMSRLSTPGKSIVFNPDRNVLLHSILKPTFYKQFCAGETGSETRATMDHLQKMGFRGTILTYAKETVFDHHTNTQHGLGVGTEASNATQECENIAAWRKGTLKTVDLLQEGDQLAVKLTGAGPLVNEALAAGKLPPKQMMDALYEVADRCKDQKARILVDAESQHFQWGIMEVGLDLMDKYNRDGYALIYNTYQAYLKSTKDTLSKHLAIASKEGFTLGLKLVRGAYLSSDERSLIHDTKQGTDDAYNSIAQGALRQEIGEFGVKNGLPFPSVNLILASHNKDSVMAAHQLHQQRLKEGLPTVPVGFAQLQGMSDEVSFGLLQLKRGGTGAPEVYKCSTWGGLGECLAYLVRRALENRDAASRTVDEFEALKAETWRRLRSAFSSSRAAP